MSYWKKVLIDGEPPLCSTKEEQAWYKQQEAKQEKYLIVDKKIADEKPELDRMILGLYKQQMRVKR